VNKVIFIILAVFITIQAEVLTISFDGKKYEKEYPTNYKDAMATIDLLIYLINDFDSSFSRIDSSYTVNKLVIDSLLTKVQHNNDTIIYKNKKIDSLLNDIDSLNTKLAKDVAVKSDSAINLIQNIKTKPIFNPGISINMSSNLDNTFSIFDVSVQPMITIDRYLLSINLGGYYTNGSISKRVGISIGKFLK